MFPLAARVSAASLALALIAAPSRAQQWLFGSEIVGRDGAGMAFHAGNARTVLFGGNTANGNSDETWLFDGSDWQRAQPAHRPTARNQPALAYDSLRNRTVLFGGVSAGNIRFADTWEFDGTDWSQATPAHAPSPRTTAMTYDATNARIVLFGGEGSNYFDDTWIYDGTDWTQVATPTAPAPRSGHALAHDPVRGRTVLFGSGSAVADTWEFDGTAWVQVNVPTSPLARRNHGMTYDVQRARIVLFAGIGPGILPTPFLTDTWEYDGSTWAQVLPLHAPGPQLTSRLVYDATRQCTVLFGSGNGTGQDQANTWLLQANDWNDRSQPSARDQAAFAHDTLRSRTIMFGGQSNTWLQDTWEHDGSRWQRTLATAPLRLTGSAMVFDPQRARTVLFGGAFFNATYDATWEYDGVNWTTLSLAIRPPARTNHAMAYDARRRRIVMFGGETLVTNRSVFGDTWEFDGSAWQPITPASILPAARAQTAMVFEASQGRVVLFGGSNNSSYAGFSDTWSYDGMVWRQLAPTHVPPARHGHGLAYDTHRGRTLLFGGSLNPQTTLGDAWEFDGDDWTPVVASPSPVPKSCALVFQQHTGRTLSFGGLDANRRVLGDTTSFVPGAVATFTRHGSGCPGSAGTPVLDTVPPALPGLGTNFPLRLSSLPAGPGLALLTLGFDLGQWNGSALPIELTAFGLPGCDLWIGPTSGLGALLPYAGTATYSLVLPASPVLAGWRLGAQALVFDPAAANGLGAVSNAVILRLY